MSSARKNVHVDYGQNKLTVLVLIQEDAECLWAESIKHIKLYTTWNVGTDSMISSLLPYIL